LAPLTPMPSHFLSNFLSSVILFLGKGRFFLMAACS